jgi:hypothetical protein
LGSGAGRNSRSAKNFHAGAKNSGSEVRNDCAIRILAAKGIYIDFLSGIADSTDQHSTFAGAY